MPKPVYIICSESGSEDKVTGLVSYFKVFEQILLQEVPPPEAGKTLVIPAMPFQFTVVWAMSDEDCVGDEFETSHSLFFPPDGREVPVTAGSCFYEEGKPRLRFVFVLSQLMFKDAGLFRVESKIRRTSEGPWLTQSYEIPVIKHPAPSILGGEGRGPGENGSPTGGSDS